MSTTQSGTGTMRIKRVIRAPRERIYNAFLDADALGKFSPPAGFTGRFEPVDARIGGTVRGSFTSLDKKEHHAFRGVYQELVPFERIVHTDAFETDLPDLQGEMRVTITLAEAEHGIEVSVVQENLPAVVPVSDATAGWGMSLENLARLVEVPA